MNLSKIKIKQEIIHITKAEPCRKRSIFLWLITNGRKGRLFRPKQQEMMKYTPQHVNCRCSMQPVKPD